MFGSCIESLVFLYRPIQDAPVAKLIDVVSEILRGVYSSIIPPPPPWGWGKESKGLRAREENQRRVEKMERQREKKRKISVGNS